MRRGFSQTARPSVQSASREESAIWGRQRFPHVAADTALLGVLLTAVVTLFSIQAARVYVSDLVFVVDQSRRLLLLLFVLLVFASPILAPILDYLSRGNLLLLTGGFLAVTRSALQFVEWPVGRLVLSGLSFAAAGWLFVLLLRSQAQAGLGIPIGWGLDLALRTARGTLDLPWIPGLGSHLATLALSLLVVACLIGFLSDRRRTEQRSALSLLSLGPAWGLGFLVTGNIGFATVHTGRPFPAATGLLGLGLLAGLLLTPLLTRHWLGWLLVSFLGGAGLVLAWGEGWRAGVGILLASASWLGFTLIGAIGGQLSSRQSGLTRPALALSIGQVILVLLLFRYYTATGDRWVPLALWAMLALVAAFVWPGRWPAGTLVLLPHVLLIVFLPLVGAMVWQLLQRPPLQGERPLKREITVMTYNIQSGYSRDHRWNLEETARVIESSGADIVLLQEVSRGWLVTSNADQLLWLERRLGLRGSWGPASQDGLWGNAILARSQPLHKQVIHFSRTQNLRRGALAVQFATDMGTVWAVTTHLDDPRDATRARLSQIEELVVFLEGWRPLVVGGDFNAEPGSGEISRLEAAGLRDPAAELAVLSPTSADNRRIDYVFVRGKLTPLAVEVPDVSASDHRPVVVGLLLQE